MKPERGFRIAAAFLMLGCSAAAQPQRDSTGETGWTLGIAAGANIPLGAWSDHPYAEGVKQFGTSWTVSAELEYRTSARFGLALLGCHAPLATRGWTDYAGSRGSSISASASVTMLLLALRPRSYTDGTNAITLQFAGGILFSSGREEFGPLSYDYTFLPATSPVFSAGLEYERWIGENSALFLRGTFALASSALLYGDGRTTGIRMVPVVAGFRMRL